MSRSIIIQGAREHNLKNVSITLPRNRLVVITGLSGSGKSSLAFDTLYAEGQRRYLESLSAYARQFMEQMRKPDVDSIEGLSPSISIEQKNISRNPRSTVGTVTEIYDYLRLLYSRIGTAFCPSCQKPIQTQTPSQITDQVLKNPEGTKFAILAPIARGKKGEFQKEILELRNRGYLRARIDGSEVNLSFPIRLQKNVKHDISVFVDRLILKPGIETRLAEAIETAVKLGGGVVQYETYREKTVDETRFFSTRYACPDCGTSLPELEPRSFSFNSPHGACPECNGLGVQQIIDPKKIVPDPSLSLSQGAIAAWADKSEGWRDQILGTLSQHFGFSLESAFATLAERIQKVLLYGSKEELVFSTGRHQFKQEFEGVIPPLASLLTGELEPDEWAEVEPFVTWQPCSLCQGARLRVEMLSVKVGGLNIADFCNLPIDRALDQIRATTFTAAQTPVAQPILKEIHSRLEFLINVGLAYLTLNRSAATLSGGEAQRIRLATQIGSNLVGVLYVLDEPSIGLHQRDNEKLIATLEKLRDLGNTVIVVEHDEDTIRKADFVVDIGPGAGERGGSILYSGTPDDLNEDTPGLTAKYLRGKVVVPLPTKRRPLTDKALVIRGAKAHNLRDLTVSFPLGTFICVTGVSGSGKSSLIIDTLLPAVQNHVLRRASLSKHLEKLEGLENLDKVVHVDQSPIGRTPRSNPATYTGMFTDIRTLFSELPESKARGYKPSRFSFNVAGGRCEACGGDGTLRISMNFMPDVFTTCEICQGKRYNRETLEVVYRGKNIADVLAMTIEQGASFFERVPGLKAKFETLLSVGLGYLQIGQSAVTLSGGEAQRIKLSKELNRRATGKTLYVLDEPTTGLHFEDVRNLVDMLHRLVNQGNTVLVIEHHLDVIKQADFVVDLGPEGGEKGGRLVFAGTPEDLATQGESHTGRYLKGVLQGRRAE